MATLQYPACYRPLPPGYDTARLLFLLPSKDENAQICCQLVDYSLRGHGRKGHLYECLSYCWGSSEKPCSISIDSIALPITKSLHEALSQLRDPSLQRPLWVDAVCINQEDNDEKEQQIQMMATIYSQARQVIVWLGPEADDSDHAIELIRLAGAGRITELSGGEPEIEYSDDYSDDFNVKSRNHLRNQRSKNQAAVTALLQRPWFRRIWVLQEIAAAKHVHIMCGTAEIAGYSLCLGIDSLKDLYEAQPAIKTLVYSVGHLIRGGFFRSNTDMVAAGRSSLNIRPLGELLDMYHAHQATLSHDKIYALLAMCSDDVSKAGIMPNYDMPWEKLLQTVLKYILSEQAVVQVWPETTLSIIKGKGTIIGYIHEVHPATITNEKQEATLAIAVASEYKKTCWSIQPSAHPVHIGDIVCLFQGSSKLSIIRACENHFVVIAIASTPPEVCRSPENISTMHRSLFPIKHRFDEGRKWSDVLRLIESAPVDFVLVWDWIWDNDPQQNMEEHHLPPNNHEIQESLHAVKECYETGVRAAIRTIIRYFDPEVRYWMNRRMNHPMNTTFERLIKCNTDFYITKDLFLEVMSSGWARRFLDIVFDQEPEENILAATSESVLVGATRRCVWESLTPFLKHFGEDIHITEAVWLAVLSNRTHDYHQLIDQLLRVHKRIRIEAPITKAMLAAAAEVNHLEKLLEILFYQKLRNRNKNRVPFTEAMIIAATKNFHSVATLKFLFDQNQRNSNKNQVLITEAVILAAASRRYDSVVVLDFLFDQNQRAGIDNRALITEAVLETVKKSQGDLGLNRMMYWSSYG
ncbi:hypothetical protein ACMFMG_000216 [Clarireedia jacksonii]